MTRQRRGTTPSAESGGKVSPRLDLSPSNKSSHSASGILSYLSQWRQWNLKLTAGVFAAFCVINVVLLQWRLSTSINQKLPYEEESLAINVTANDDRSLASACPVSIGMDAIQALEKAKDIQCKRKIVDTSCRLARGQLTPKRIPRSCPKADTRSALSYIGCYADDPKNRLLSGADYKLKETNSIEECVDHCLRIGFQLAGMQYSHECFCGHKAMLENTQPLEASACQQYRCPGAPEQFCGGFLTMVVYNTGFGDLLHNNLPPMNQLNTTDPEPVTTTVGHKSPVRIVFLLQLAGRNTRQVRRLLKSLYRPQHYYFVHVDARQEYLYQDLMSLQRVLMAQDIHNVYVTSSRHSSIWGGASLLTMYLDACQQILKLGWTWDYVINLSESDFMLASMNDLEALLNKYRGHSFLRSHGAQPARFVERQGLNFVFVECENRMWRVGQRDYMPNGIWLDGGSDWIILDRAFVEYVVNEQDELFTSLRSMYANVLLPIESFFHTILYNSRFCDRVINSNLRMTNWNRERGCHCQYKHVVDWCGCSPMALQSIDTEKLQRFDKRNWYFARKFDSIIDQRIIERVEEMHRGNSSPYVDTPTFRTAWQNDFDYSIDLPSNKSSVTLKRMFIESIARRVAGQVATDSQYKCRVTEQSALALHVVRRFDAQRSHPLIVGTFKLFCLAPNSNPGEKEEVVLVETLVKRQLHSTFDDDVGKGVPIELEFLDVASDYDVKERMFRNYAGLLTSDSIPTVAHYWAVPPIKSDENLNSDVFYELPISLAWRDPTGQVANADGHLIRFDPSKGYEAFNFTKLELTSLTPGVWTLELYVRDVKWHSLAFPVLDPNSQPIAEFDQLINQFFIIKDVCVSEKNAVFAKSVKSPRNDAGDVPSAQIGCESTNWASTAFDGKSSIVEGRFDHDLQMLV